MWPFGDENYKTLKVDLGPVGWDIYYTCVYTSYISSELWGQDAKISGNAFAENGRLVLT